MLKRFLGPAQIEAGLFEGVSPPSAFDHEDRDVRPAAEHLVGDPREHKQTFGRLGVDERQILGLAIRCHDSLGVDDVGKHVAVQAQLTPVVIFGKLRWNNRVIDVQMHSHQNTQSCAERTQPGYPGERGADTLRYRVARLRT